MSDPIDSAWIEPHLGDCGGFPRPDWSAIAAHIEDAVPEGRRHGAWDLAARTWLGRTAGFLGRGYRVLESRNFLLLAPPLDGAELALGRFLEHARGTVLDHLPGIAGDEGYGRHAAIVLSNRDLYYDYVDGFHPPGGTYPFTGGLCIDAGYVHFVVPWSGLAEAERAVAHELTHDCLGHLPLPAWLDEGMAVVVEGIATERSRRLMTAEQLRDQRATWNRDGIQDFWSGASFHRPVDGFELGYTLGYHMVKVLSRDFDRFREFVLKARHDDAGAAALEEVYGQTLAGLATTVLGPGDWAPRPDAWRCTDPPTHEEDQ